MRSDQEQKRRLETYRLIEAAQQGDEEARARLIREKMCIRDRSYCGRIKVHCVNLLGIQEAIGENCPEDEMTILSRRFMMMIAERIARDNGCDMLITGENIGQVASQTAQGLVVTDNAVSMPVMRPLIAMDKVDIMDLAQKVGTYETSIQPFEDCCTCLLYTSSTIIWCRLLPQSRFWIWWEVRIRIFICST